MEFQEGYNPVNTAFYALILVVAAYLTYRLLKLLKIRIDKRFALAIAPHVIVASILRVFQDAGIVNSYLFVTPFIFFWSVPVILLILSISKVIEKKSGIPYFKIAFIVGILALAFVINKLNFVNFLALEKVIVFFLPWVVILGLMKFWSVENRLVMLVQMFDATTTFVSLNFFNYFEQHVLPRFFIDFLGPWSFIPLKFAGVAIILLLIDRFSEDRDFNNYLKIAIAVIAGFTSGRDFIRLLAFV